MVAAAACLECLAILLIWEPGWSVMGQKTKLLLCSKHKETSEFESKTGFGFLLCLLIVGTLRRLLVSSVLMLEMGGR